MSPVTPSALCGTLQVFPTISAPQRNKSTQGKRWLASISLNSTEWATDMKKCEISSQKITNYRRHVLHSLRLSLNLLPDDNGNIVSLPPGFLLVSSLHQRRLVGWVSGKKKKLDLWSSEQACALAKQLPSEELNDPKLGHSWEKQTAVEDEA